VENEAEPALPEGAPVDVRRYRVERGRGRRLTEIRRAAGGRTIQQRSRERRRKRSSDEAGANAEKEVVVEVPTASVRWIFSPIRTVEDKPLL
jgi:hypothetical protein